MKRYINLNAHSNSSFGETVVTPEEIVEFAVKDSAKAIALTDLNSVQGLFEFSKAAEKYKEKGFKPIYGVQIFGMNPDKSSAPRKITLLAKNRNGLKNIYRIMSMGYITVLSDAKWPCVSYEDIQNNREGVLVGFECTKSDVYRVWTDEQDHEGEKTNELVLEEYAIADYVEIKPWRWYMGMIGNLANAFAPEEATIKWILYEIVGTLEAVNKYAIAANCSNCITKQDELCYNILHDCSSDMQTNPERFLTTEEMLADYSLPDGEYFIPNLSKVRDMAKALVLDNPNTIADMIDDFLIELDERYEFDIANAKEILVKSSKKALHEKYGESVPEFILERYKSEINGIISAGFESYYVLASMLSEKSRELGYLHNLRGCAGGSFVAYLMEISETNPLPPHYYCPQCKRVEFVDAKEYPSGFDLNCCGVERKTCPSCGYVLVGDGHNIPVEFFAGFDGHKVPDFDFNFASDIQKDMVEYLGQIFGADKTFYAGTEGTFSCRLSENLIADYCNENNIQLTPDEKNKIIDRLSYVHRSDGNHPGGIVIVPENKEIFDFTPVGYRGEFQLKNSMKPATLIEYHKLPLGKIDILGHSMLSKIKLMEEMTGISAKTIRFEEIDINTFFCDDSFRGLPFNGEFVRGITDVMPTTKFSDLVRIFGFAHGTNVWTDNGEELIEKGCDPNELIAHREDVMLTLLRYGLDRKTAFQLAEMVRKGTAERCLTNEQEACLREHDIPEWYIESMKKIRYLFPKSHSVEYVTNYLRMIWYKIYCPAAFYAAVLTVDAADFDYSILAEGKKRIELELSRFYQEWGSNPTFDYRNGEGWAEKQKDIMELALECYEKGISFFPKDINASDPYRFIPDGDAIRLPFNCPVEIDEDGVKVILKERNIKPFKSLQDFAKRTNLSEQFLEKLRKNNSLELFDDFPKRNFVKLSEIAEKVMQEDFFLKISEKNPAVDCVGSATLMATGLESLDRLLTSFKSGQLYVIGSRPGMGKTALLIQIALSIVALTNKSVYIQSLEMTAEQIVQRMISQIVDIDQMTVRSGNLSNNQKNLMYLCWSIMDAMPIYICDTVASMEEISRFVKNEAEDGVLLIDYLQLIDAYVDSGNNRAYSKASVNRISEVSCALKQLAQETKMPIIVCSQLTRALEQRSDKRPILQDLRQTGSIEQDVDGVIFVYRNSYYSNDGGDEAELILAKNRNGETGTTYVKFNRSRLMFGNK